MVHLAKKKKKGKTYLYLEERGWINGKSKRLWQIYLGPEHKFKEKSQIISIPEVETETIEFGLVAALYILAKKINLVNVINKFTEKRNQGLSVGEHLLLAAINRCVEPVSKTRLKEWLDSTVLSRLFPNLGSALDSRSYWTHFNYFDEDTFDAIGEEIAKIVMREFNVSFKELLFDPSNIFTFINPKKANQTLPRHGHSKEGRFTLNLINFSLICALDGGIPFLHLVYPGNIQDAKHFKVALGKLKMRLNKLNIPSTEITLTFDKGNLSEEAFNFIDDEGIDYIASIRPSTQKDLLTLLPNEFDIDVLPNGKEVGVKEFKRVVYGKPRRIIAIYNPTQAKWLIENFKTKIDDKIEAINRFFLERLNNERWAQAEKVFKKCHSVLGTKKFKKVVNVELSGEKGDLTLVLSINQDALDEHTSTLGKSFLITSRTDLHSQEVVWAYRQQYIVECAFKYLKNPKFLSVRPLFHRVDSSVRGHLFVCFLGLLLLTLLVRYLINRNISLSIPKAIRTLNNLKLTKITVPGRKRSLFKVNKMNSETNSIYKVLNLHQFV